MGSTRHEKSFVTYEKGYEQNILGLRGIIYFGIGLLILIVITFALMWALLKVFEDDPTRNATTPMALNERERLPPEPRLQLAPGWGVDSPNGRVNLELAQPGAELKEFQKQWDDEWKNGVRDPKTGVTSMLPIEQAKEKLLEQNVKARNDDASRNEWDQSRMSYTDASSGRVAAEKRR